MNEKNLEPNITVIKLPSSETNSESNPSTQKHSYSSYLGFFSIACSLISLLISAAHPTSESDPVFRILFINMILGILFGIVAIIWGLLTEQKNKAAIIGGVFGIILNIGVSFFVLLSLSLKVPHNHVGFLEIRINHVLSNIGSNQLFNWTA